MRDLPVPGSPHEVTGAWVRRRLGLDGAGDQLDGAPERIGEGYGLSSVLLRVRLGGGAAPGSVVVKLWSIDIPTGDREVRLLREFGDRLGPRVPACYYAEGDQAAGRAVLVLEDLREAEQGDFLSPLGVRPATRLAGALAALHATWWRDHEIEVADWLPQSPWLSLGGDWFPPRRALVRERFGDRLGEGGRRLLGEIEDVYRRATARLASAAPTLLHHDVHLDNVVFERESGQPILLDWARVATGPAALDLADLVVAGAVPEAADEVVSAYTEELRARGVPEADLGRFDRELAAAVAVSFVKLTCGVARWEPASPREANMIGHGIDHARRSADRWVGRHPELFQGEV